MTMADDKDAAEAAPAKGKSKKKLLLVVVGVVVLLGGGLGGAFALGLFGGGEAEEATADDHGAPAGGAHGDAHPAPAANGDGHAAATQNDGHGGGAPAGAPVFVDLPQLLVNLSVGDGRPRFLKLSIAVEVDDQVTADRIGQVSPRIVDSFQMYLRTLTPAELQTPGAMFRLKEDLHVRIHQAIEPMRVADVLFKEMLVQ
jgi:flagellar protein FliL